MSEWQDLELGDSLDLLIDNRGKNPPFTHEEGIPCVSGMAVTNSGLDLSRSKSVTTETWKKWMPSPTRRHDVVLTSEAPLGRTAIVPSDAPLMLAQRVFGLRGKRGILDSRFLYYALKTDAVQAELHGRATGTTVVGIRQPALLQARIPAPDYSDQLAIAKVLGTLDDKIAANTKLAGTADDLATTLFAEAVRKASRGSATFDDLAKVSGGGTPSTKVPDYWEGSVPWATPTDITSLSGPYLESTSRTISEAGLHNCASELYPSGSILMTSRATIGAFAIAQESIAVNQGFIVVQPHDVPMYWLFHEMRSRVDEFVSMANGATFLELSRGNFKKLSVRLADSRVMGAFAFQAKGLHESARASLLESNKLAEIRDALLPQLMSGRLRVSDAEKVVEEVV